MGGVEIKIFEGPRVEFFFYMLDSFANWMSGNSSKEGGVGYNQLVYTINRCLITYLN